MAQRGVVLVGVDGSTAAEAAVRYAAREADRRESSLTLLHVIPALASGTLPGTADPGVLADIDPRLRHRRDEVLGRSAVLAGDVLTEERIATRLLCGDRVGMLLGAAEEASLLVLGAAWHPWIDRLITGSVVVGVASHASVPIVAVPDGWSAAREHGRVVVAVKSPEDAAAPGLVARAIEEAAARKAALTILHAWEFPVVYDNMVATTLEEQAWCTVKRDSLEELVALAPPHEVGIDFRIVHGQGAHAIVQASRTADLVVIGRRRRHLGGAGRAVLREVVCPAMVLPPRLS